MQARNPKAYIEPPAAALDGLIVHVPDDVLQGIPDGNSDTNIAPGRMFMLPENATGWRNTKTYRNSNFQIQFKFGLNFDENYLHKQTFVILL